MKIVQIRVRPKTAFMILGVVAFAVITYFFIVPTVVANRYLSQLDHEVKRIKSDLKSASSGSSVSIFEDPGIKMDKRQEVINKSLEQVQKAQKSLDSLQDANKLAALPGNGFAGRYHQALVRQEHTSNIIRQSQQILGEYAAALKYISAYTDARAYLERQLTYLNTVHDFNKLIGQGSAMELIARELKTHQQKLASQKPPPGFEPIHGDSLQTLDNASSNFSRLAAGLNKPSNVEIYGAIKILEQIALKHEVDDKEIMTDLAQKSPSLLQLADLYEKIENVQQQ